MTGGVICLAGVIFTFVIPTGYIWWGAIVFGGLMCVQGLAQGKG